MDTGSRDAALRLMSSCAQIDVAQVDVEREVGMLAAKEHLPLLWKAKGGDLGAAEYVAAGRGDDVYVL
jgi:hypothetical protein